MSRAELELLLADLQERRAIKPEQAVRLMALFDAGELSPQDLPLPLPAQVDNGELWIIALAVALFLAKGSIDKPLSQAVRRRTRDLLRDSFNERSRALTLLYAGGGLRLAQWQGQMQASIADYARQMAVVGAGGLPIAQVRGRVDQELDRQWPFLARLAVQMAATRVSGQLLSDAYLVNRARAYGGPGWAAYFVGQSQDHLDSYGWVERWRTREDGAVCRRCLVYSRQYFLPGQGPIPGVDCYAGGYCRCLRIPEYNEPIYLQLGGQRRSSS